MGGHPMSPSGGRRCHSVLTIQRLNDLTPSPRPWQPRPSGRGYHPSQPKLRVQRAVRNDCHLRAAIACFADVVERHASGAVDREEVIRLPFNCYWIIPIDLEET